MPGEDTLISKGFSVEEAKDTTEAFEKYCRDHADEIEALRIIYNQSGEPINFDMMKDLENKLKMENNRFSTKQLWNSYAIVSPNHVRRATKKEESEALTNIIQLVRFAYRQIENWTAFALLPDNTSIFGVVSGIVTYQNDRSSS